MLPPDDKHNIVSLNIMGKCHYCPSFRTCTISDFEEKKTLQCVIMYHLLTTCIYTIN